MPRKMKRECSVCGNEMLINVKKDGSYFPGHYFGKVSVPVKGTGEHRRTGTSVLDKYSMTEFTGEKKEVEYWECDFCYDRQEEKRKAP